MFLPIDYYILLLYFFHLKDLILRHIKFTNSILAKKIIANWATEKKKFWQVVPLEIIEKLKNPVLSEKNTVLQKKLA